MNHLCFICGYKGLSELPYDAYNCPSHEICSCCGFQYGLDDDVEIEDGKWMTIKESHAHYRKNWLLSGCLVSSDYYPKEWRKDGRVNPDIVQKQLENF